MAEDPKNKKTQKEGLSEAARKALEAAASAADEESSEESSAAEESAEAEASAKSEPPPAKKPEKKEASTEKNVAAKKDPGHGATKASAGVTRPAMLLAEYETPGACMHAAEALRDAGYTKFDAHTPFPVHGMDKAMGLPDSPLGWIVLVCGLTGVTAGFAMMYWMNNVDYPIVIGGKPPTIASLPSMIPIMFELTVLFSAFGTVLGMFHLNKLPQHHHPVFASDRFARFSDDRFFISVEAADPKFKLEKTRELLDKTHPSFVEVVPEEEEES